MEPYRDAGVTRGLAYGPNARNRVDVFTAPNAGRGRRPVLIFVPGGGGDLREPIPQGAPFYDNVLLWAVKNGFVGVNVMREQGAWDVGARNIADVLDWTAANIARYGGDPSRIFIWGHSSGANALSVYLAFPQWRRPAAEGLKGAALMAGGYNLAPFQLPPLQPLNPATAPPPPPPSPLEQSVLPGLKTTTAPLFVSVGALEPPRQISAARILYQELCKAGHCPTFEEIAGHGHLSAVFSINTPDQSGSRAQRLWMRKLLRATPERRP